MAAEELSDACARVYEANVRFMIAIVAAFTIVAVVLAIVPDDACVDRDDHAEIGSSGAVNEDAKAEGND